MEDQKSVLIIEDDCDLRKMYQMQISQAGFSVDTAENGEIGIEKAQRIKPDLIILDLIIPKISGFEVLKKLKASKKTVGIPVIVLSNLGQYDDIKLVRELGAIAYLIKSKISLKKLVEKVRAVLV